MNYKKVFKRETKVIAYVVIALTLVVIGTSYALFLQVNNNQDNQVVTAGSLVIEYAKGNTVTVDENAENNCLKPQSDETGSSTGGCNFTLSITNKGTLPMQYDLLIYNNTTDVDIPSDAQFVDHSLVRHSLNKQYSQEGSNSETITSAKALSELALKENKRVLESSMIDVGETITFSLNIWISEDATVDIIGQYVYLKLDVVGSVYEGTSAANLLTNDTKSASLEEINMPTTYSSESAKKEYRYTGENPNNYVYFNCKDTNSVDTCELWRILGITEEGNLKIIKDSQDIEKAFNDKEDANFDTSTIKKYLNNEYYNSLNEETKSYIKPTSYRTNGTGSLEINALEMFGEEISQDETSFANVGLLNASDYAFASSIDNVEPLNILGNVKSSNWLYTTKNEWLINKSGNTVYSVNEEGNIVLSSPLETKLVRPVVYLNYNVMIVKGDGAKTNPYILSK